MDCDNSMRFRANSTGSIKDALLDSFKSSNCEVFHRNNTKSKSFKTQSKNHKVKLDFKNFEDLNKEKNDKTRFWSVSEGITSADKPQNFVSISRRNSRVYEKLNQLQVPQTLNSHFSSGYNEHTLHYATALNSPHQILHFTGGKFFSHKHRTFSRSLPIKLNCLENFQDIYDIANTETYDLHRKIMERLRRRSRHPSGASGYTNDSRNDSEYFDEINSVFSNFNVSPSDSLNIKAMRIAIASYDNLLTSKFIDYIMLLGQFTGDEDDDEVFIDEAENTEKSVYLSLNCIDYNITLVDANIAEISEGNNFSAIIVIISSNLEDEQTKFKLGIDQLPTFISSSDTFLLHIRNTSSSNNDRIADFTRLSADKGYNYYDMSSFNNSNILTYMECIIKTLDPEQNNFNDTLHLVGTPTILTSNNLDTIDKSSLFNRLFWRSSLTRSCENLLAL